MLHDRPRASVLLEVDLSIRSESYYTAITTVQIGPAMHGRLLHIALFIGAAIHGSLPYIPSFTGAAMHGWLLHIALFIGAAIHGKLPHIPLFTGAAMHGSHPHHGRLRRANQFLHGWCCMDFFIIFAGDYRCCRFASTM